MAGASYSPFRGASATSPVIVGLRCPPTTCPAVAPLGFLCGILSFLFFRRVVMGFGGKLRTSGAELSAPTLLPCSLSPPLPCTWSKLFLPFLLRQSNFISWRNVCPPRLYDPGRRPPFYPFSVSCDQESSLGKGFIPIPRSCFFFLRPPWSGKTTGGVFLEEEVRGAFPAVGPVLFVRSFSLGLNAI